MRNKLLMLFLGIILLSISLIGHATTVTFTVADIKGAIGDLHDSNHQWGLWAVRVRPVIESGSYTMTDASVTQEGWSAEAPSSYAWGTYGTGCAWFFDESGAETAGTPSNPLYMIMDVEASTFWSGGFNKNGFWVANWAPGPDGIKGTADDLGTFLDSGYDNGAGGTNVITAVDGSETFSFDFTLDSGSWSGLLEFLVDGSKYNLGTAASPQTFVENFFGGYVDGGGLTENTGDGYLLSLPGADEVWVDDDYTEARHGGHVWGYDAFTTIQEGIDAVEEGGTVNAAAGTYDIAAMGGPSYEPVSINKSITLKGAGSASTTLDPQYPTGVHCDVISVQASGVTIEGFTVTGGDFGVRISSPSAQTGLVFIDVLATDNHGSGFVFDNLYGNQSVSDVTFLNCQANGNGNRGIYFAPNKTASNVSLTDTDCNNNQIMGFNCQGTMTGLVISGGTFNNNVGGSPYGTTEGPYYGFGISLENCINSTINDITIQGNGTAGPVEGGAGIIVKGNSDGVTIEGATVHENQSGLWVEDSWTVGNTSGPFAQNISINFSNIEDNTDFGVRNYTNPTTVDATQNWWGHESGPHNETTNPEGAGDEVSDNVLYYHWYTDDSLTTLFSANAITLTKTGPANAKEDDEITYLVHYKNEGNFTETNLVITETYPPEVDFISSVPAPDTGTTNQWTVGTLESGVEGTIEIIVKIK